MWDYRHTVLLLHFLTWGFIAMHRMLVVFVAPQMVPDLGFSFTQFGLVMSALTVTWALCAFFGGHLSDRIGRVKVVVASTFLFSIPTWITSVVTGFGQLVIVRALTGIGGGAYWGAGVAHISEAWPESRRGFALGLHQTGFPVFGTFIGAAFAGYVTQVWGWRTVFPIAGIAGIILAFVFWKFIHEPKSFTDRQAAQTAEEKIGFGHTMEILKQRNLIVNLAVISAVMIGWWSIYTFLALFLTQVKGFNIAVAGGVAGITGVTGLFGQWVTAWVSDHTGRKPVLWVVAAGMAIGTYLIIISTSTTVLVIGLAVVGYCSYAPFSVCIAAIPADAAPPKLIGTAAGIAMMVSELVGMLGPIVGGMLNDAYGLRASLWLTIAAYIVAGLLVAFMTETAPSRRAVAVEAASMANPA